MKIILSELQYIKLNEQSMFGWGSNLPPGAATEVAKGWSNSLSLANVDVESELRNFLYSPVGIASTIGINLLGGEPLTMALFTVLISYDIKKWIDLGEPNWLYLICDLICVLTAGFAGEVGVRMISVGKNIKFESLFGLISWIEKTFPEILTKYILPFMKSCSMVISKVISLLEKFKNNPTVGKFFKFPKNLIVIIENVISYLNKIVAIIEETLTKYFGKLVTKTGGGYVKYKVRAEIAKTAAETESGKEIIKKVFPYVNVLLGSDKIDPFLIDLMNSPNKIDLSKYKINPIFLDNSKDFL